MCSGTNKYSKAIVAKDYRGKINIRMGVGREFNFRKVVRANQLPVIVAKFNYKQYLVATIL